MSGAGNDKPIAQTGTGVCAVHLVTVSMSGNPLGGRSIGYKGSDVVTKFRIDSITATDWRPPSYSGSAVIWGLPNRQGRPT